MLLRLGPSPIAELNRAVALCHVVGAAAALKRLATTLGRLPGRRGRVRNLFDALPAWWD